MDQQRAEKNQDEIQEVLGLMERYESIQYARQRSKILAQRAYTQFNQEFSHLPASPAKDIFLRLIHFFIEREY
jgi:geranylgeranyl diphosphate synthase type II